MNARRLLRSVRLGLGALALAAMACGKNPETTERARGVLEGMPLVLAMSVAFLVVAGGLVIGAVGLDRLVRSRRTLDATPTVADVEEPEEEVVAGIGVGRAAVPRWLYGFYVVIPVFAMLYVFNNVALAPPAAEEPAATKAPASLTDVTIVSSGIKFDLTEIRLQADTEVTVTFDNQDANIPHTFTIWESEADFPNGDPIADTGQFNGIAEEVLEFTTPAPGEAYFNCIVHPAMAGTVEFVAE